MPPCKLASGCAAAPWAAGAPDSSAFDAVERRGAAAASTTTRPMRTGASPGSVAAAGCSAAPGCTAARWGCPAATFEPAMPGCSPVRFGAAAQASLAPPGCCTAPGCAAAPACGAAAARRAAPGGAAAPPGPTTVPDWPAAGRASSRRRTPAAAARAALAAALADTDTRSPLTGHAACEPAAPRVPGAGALGLAGAAAAAHSCVPGQRPTLPLLLPSSAMCGAPSELPLASTGRPAKGPPASVAAMGNACRALASTGLVAWGARPLRGPAGARAAASYSAGALLPCPKRNGSTQRGMPGRGRATFCCCWGVAVEPVQLRQKVARARHLRVGTLRLNG